MGILLGNSPGIPGWEIPNFLPHTIQESQPLPLFSPLFSTFFLGILRLVINRGKRGEKEKTTWEKNSQRNQNHQGKEGKLKINKARRLRKQPIPGFCSAGIPKIPDAPTIPGPCSVTAAGSRRESPRESPQESSQPIPRSSPCPRKVGKVREKKVPGKKSSGKIQVVVGWLVG